ncbi:hypothetical protein TNCV_2355101 [Trichonephila clavipes]|nr:hypothetical protein TNCV_2355101 [Trichonephila clavipes]
MMGIWKEKLFPSKIDLGRLQWLRGSTPTKARGCRFDPSWSRYIFWMRISALARQLIDGYSPRKMKGCHASFQAKECVVLDDVRLNSVGNHMPKMVSNERRCENEAEGTRKENLLHVQNVIFPLCIATCLSSFHD